MTPCASPIAPTSVIRPVRRAAEARLFARRPYEAGEPILQFDHPRWILEPRAGAIETADGQRLFDPLLALITHSETPNARVSLELLTLIARRDIAAGEPLTRDWLARGRPDLANGGAILAPPAGC
jgi:hypothetical protein